MTLPSTQNPNWCAFQSHASLSKAAPADMLLHWSISVVFRRTQALHSLSLHGSVVALPCNLQTHVSVGGHVFASIAETVVYWANTHPCNVARKKSIGLTIILSCVVQFFLYIQKPRQSKKKPVANIQNIRNENRWITPTWCLVYKQFVWRNSVASMQRVAFHYGRVVWYTFDKSPGVLRGLRYFSRQ